jgi:putative DNA primase/helicase
MAFDDLKQDTAPEGDACISPAENAAQNLSKLDIDDPIHSAQTLTIINSTEATQSPIPSEQERPLFVALDEQYTAADGSKYRAGVWYFGIKPTKGDNPPALVQHLICSPMHVEALTHDSAQNNFGRLLRFANALGKWRQWAMPMEMLKGDGADLRGALLSMGVQLDPGNAARHMLATYLQSRIPPKRLEAVLQTGWAGGDFKAYALPDTVIGPQASKVTFQAQGLHADEYTQRGTLEGWKQTMAAPAVGNPVLCLGLCAAFAGPVQALVGIESGGLHLIGDSSTGKTTALQAACSVWGGESFRRSWRATANGLEGAAALFNDGLLALDEISECDPRDVGEVVYMLGNGRGKQRASRTGTARTVTYWRCSVLSTGERSIAASMMEAGQRVKAGQAVRLLDIPVQRTYGAWDTLHGHSNGPAFSDAIKRAARQQYGTAGRAFLEKLTRDTSDMATRLEAIKAQLMEGITTEDGQPARAAARLAVLALAGELATTYGITDWPEGEAIKAARVGFGAWLAQRGNVTGNAENDQVIRAVMDFIDRHGDSRFSDASGPYDDKQQAMVRDRAGWWEGTGDGVQYLFTSEGLRDALKGFDFGRALNALEQAGVLEPGPGGKSSHSKRIHSRRVRVYIVTPNTMPEVAA